MEKLQVEFVCQEEGPEKTALEHFEERTEKKKKEGCGGSERQTQTPPEKPSAIFVFSTRQTS